MVNVGGNDTQASGYEVSCFESGRLYAARSNVDSFSEIVFSISRLLMISAY